jgi:hypothetical protein
MASLAALVLCGPVSAADEELATVGGKVIYNGQPLTGSTITFHLEDGQFVGGRIKDGRFLVKRVPAGTWKVTIESKTVTLPAKFTSPEESGLGVEAKKGQIGVNFMLSDRGDESRSLQHSPRIRQA